MPTPMKTAIKKSSNSTSSSCEVIEQETCGEAEEKTRGDPAEERNR
jgi:hypothetical protein